MRNDSGSTSSPFDYGLRSRLLLLLVVMLLPFIIFSLYQAYHGYNRQLKERSTENTRDAREIAGNVDELVQSTADLLVAFANSQTAREQDFDELKKWFKVVSAEYPYYKNIIFVDLDGNIRAAAKTYSKPDGKIIANVKETAYYKRSIKANGLAYGDFMHGRISNKPVIHITYPAYGRDGRRIGFVAISFDLARLQNRIVTVNIAHGSEVSVLDRNGTVIARTLDPERWVGKCFKSDPVIRAAQTGQNITAPGPDDIVRLMSFGKTKQAPWLVAVCTEEAVIRNQALAEFFKQLALVVPLLLIALIGWLWIGRDVDGLYKTARRLGLADPMTGLGSFVKFNEDLAKDMARAKRQIQPLSLLIADIEAFRLFNEGYGYQDGNTALKHISSIIKANLRDTDFAYRYGGDEIALLLTDTDELDAVEFAEKIRAKISETPFTTRDGQHAKLTVSIGITIYPLDASDADGLVQCATEALFEAKENPDEGIMAYSQTARPSKVKRSTG